MPDQETDQQADVQAADATAPELRDLQVEGRAIASLTLRRIVWPARRAIPPLPPLQALSGLHDCTTTTRRAGPLVSPAAHQARARVASGRIEYGVREDGCRLPWRSSAAAPWTHLD